LIVILCLRHENSDYATADKHAVLFLVNSHSIIFFSLLIN